ncbi:hypothetical protein ACFVZH_39660 [Streptomyces sp. NPDC059534]|uniref:hypothetical protein n=1 Tax=Streptomyces sp. NPDC059534 TaxID=3346859 RepID=UPI0036C328C7
MAADDGEVLERAAADVAAVQRALRAARRALSDAVVAARQQGEPEWRVAERSGLDPVTIRNILAAAEAAAEASSPGQ